MTHILIVTAAIVLPLLTTRLIIGEVEWAFWITGVATVAAHTYLWKEVVTMPPSLDRMGVILIMLILSGLSAFLVGVELDFYSSKRH